MTKNDSFDADALKDIRDHVRTFIKLDLTYLAAFGAIITALKIGSSELLELTYSFWPFALPYIALCAVDVSIDSILFKNWMTARSHGTKVQFTNLVKRLLNEQPKLHFLFFCFLLMLLTLTANAKQNMLGEVEMKAEIQEAVEIFIIKKGTAPKSYDELVMDNKKLLSRFKTFDKNQLKFETLSNKKYKIIFSGADNKFDTDDDEIYTDAYQIRDVWKNLKKSKSEISEVN